MPDLTIRPVRRPDYQAIVELAESPEELFLAFPGGHWPFDQRQIHKLADSRLDLTVCAQDTQVCGFANLYDCQPGQWAFIGNLIIKRSMRGKGLGKRLLSHMLSLIYDKHELPQARLSVFSQNQPALMLYKHAGFEIYAEARRSDPNGREHTLLHLKRDKD